MFFLFIYDQYYPGGPESDCYGVYPTQEEAVKIGREKGAGRDFCYVCTASLGESRAEGDGGFTGVWDLDDERYADDESEEPEPTKKNFYFTFGQGHVYSVDGYTYDKDVVVLIEAEDEGKARKIMCDSFGLKWELCYKELPNMRYFPRGVKKL